jgi:hypothetical protein
VCWRKSQRPFMTIQVGQLKQDFTQLLVSTNIFMVHPHN